jgi:outer membrane protein assembly factor BamE (lipoprotein component of BamABCDE complex)
MIKKLALIAVVMILSACTTETKIVEVIVEKPQKPIEAPLANIPQRQVEAERLSLGFVQSKIKKGSTGVDVVEVLGSPNIITSSNDGGEVWVYDKISVEDERFTGQNSEVKTRTTRTMIVVIRFDKAGKVDTVQYRQTTF